MELFDQLLAEIETDDGVRYVLRRNPVRADELAASRRDKQRRVQTFLDEQNTYLAEHPRAKVEVALRKVREKIGRLKLARWLSASASQRTITLDTNADALAEDSKLDGCYVLKTDLTPKQALKETVHDRYKDLSLVEWAFRTSKTMHLEARPIFVRLASRSRSHKSEAGQVVMHVVYSQIQCQPVKIGIDRLLQGAINIDPSVPSG